MAVTLSPTTLPAGTVDENYSEQLSASGGTAPYTFAVTVGTLPAGMTLTSDGLLSGSPEAAATTTFTVTATDSASATGVAAYSLTVVQGSEEDVSCPSYYCKPVGPIQLIDIGDGRFLCPRCEQQIIVTNGVAALAPGYHD